MPPLTSCIIAKEVFTSLVAQGIFTIALVPFTLLNDSSSTIPVILSLLIKERFLRVSRIVISTGQNILLEEQACLLNGHRLLVRFWLLLHELY